MTVSKAILGLCGRHAQDGHLPGDSLAIQKIRKKLAQFTPLAYPLLIQGETGTGKEFAARYLHARRSNLRTTPFVAVNCGTLMKTLAGAELFGCKRGAFTGAEHREGLVRKADGGILFLDEVADLHLDVQVMLLRLLETGVVRPLGSDETYPVSFRLVCATHKSLAEQVKKGLFRRDLYFRLSILRLTMPPLRERQSDLPVLIKTLAPVDISPLPHGILTALEKYHFPGNLRELRNILLTLSIAQEHETLTAAHLEDLFESSVTDTEPMVTLNQKVSAYIRDCYVRHNGNIRKTARALEISPTTVYRYLSLLGSEKQVQTPVRK